MTINVKKIQLAAARLQKLLDKHSSGKLSDVEFLDKLSQLVGKSKIYPMLSELSELVCSCGLIFGLESHADDDHEATARVAKQARAKVVSFIEGTWTPSWDSLRFSYGHRVGGLIVGSISGVVMYDGINLTLRCPQPEITLEIQSIIDRGMKGKYALNNIEYLLPENIGDWVLMNSGIGQTTEVE